MTLCTADKKLNWNETLFRMHFHSEFYLILIENRILNQKTVQSNFQLHTAMPPSMLGIRRIWCVRMVQHEKYNASFSRHTGD